jgi:hypothetical protein
VYSTNHRRPVHLVVILHSYQFRIKTKIAGVRLSCGTINNQARILGLACKSTNAYFFGQLFLNRSSLDDVAVKSP